MKSRGVSTGIDPAEQRWRRRFDGAAIPAAALVGPAARRAARVWELRSWPGAAVLRIALVAERAGSTPLATLATGAAESPFPPPRWLAARCFVSRTSVS